MGAQRFQLAVEPVPVESQGERQLALVVEQRQSRIEHREALVDVAFRGVDRRRRRAEQDPPVRRGDSGGGRRPARHGPVIGVTRQPVGSERDHGVGPPRRDRIGERVDHLGVVGSLAASVPEIEHDPVVDAEHVEGGVELGAA